MDVAKDTYREEVIQQFGKAMSKRFPTFCAIRAVGSLTSQAMRDENRKRHAAALRARATKAMKRGK